MDNLSCKVLDKSANQKVSYENWHFLSVYIQLLPDSRKALV